MRTPTVLLIDGDRDTLAIFSLILGYGGLRVLQADEAESGYALAREQQPELIVLEPFVPPVRGVQLTQLLRADPLTAGLQLLVVTAVPELMEGPASCGEWGARYLVKPCAPRDLLVEVRRRLEPALSAA
jgi:two-component system, OmpR family, phosphate regulon response regulator PhoB